MNQLVPYKTYSPVPHQAVHFAVPPPPIKVASTHLVDFRGDPRDWGVLFLSLFGFYQKTIAQHQGMTVACVNYRLRKFNASRPPSERISAQDYRNGTSPVAQMAIDAVGRRVKQMLVPAVAKATNTIQAAPKTDAIEV